MSNGTFSIEELKILASTKFCAKYPDAIALHEATFSYGEQILKAQPDKLTSEVEASDIVCRNLFARLMTDLLAIKELAFNGYGIQATTLASSSFETAFMLRCIGGDNVRAKKWIKHTVWEKPVYSVYESVEMALRNDGLSKPNLKTETDRIYDMYRELCAVKHGNSQVQQHFHITRHGEDWTRTLGHDLSENSLFLSATSLCQLMGFILGAGNSFTQHHVPKASHVELSQIAEKLSKQSKEFHDYVLGKKTS
jgi:hypothetical protein